MRAIPRAAACVSVVCMSVVTKLLGGESLVAVGRRARPHEHATRFTMASPVDLIYSPRIRVRTLRTSYVAIVNYYGAAKKFIVGAVPPTLDE